MTATDIRPEVEAEIQRAERDLNTLRNQTRERAIQGLRDGYFPSVASLNAALTRLGLDPVDATPDTHYVPLVIDLRVQYVGDAQGRQRFEALRTMLANNVNVVNETVATALNEQLQRSASGHAEGVTIGNVVTRIGNVGVQSGERR